MVGLPVLGVRGNRLFEKNEGLIEFACLVKRLGPLDIDFGVTAVLAPGNSRGRQSAKNYSQENIP